MSAAASPTTAALAPSFLTPLVQLLNRHSLERCRRRPQLFGRGDAEALFYLGMSLCQTRKMVQGKDQLQKAIAAGLKEPMLSEGKRMLAPPTGK